MQCKLTKAQQAVEDKIMASLSAHQRFKMSDLAAALIYSIQTKELPMPNLDALYKPEKSSAVKNNEVPSAPLSRCDSVASGSVDLSADADVTPRADNTNAALWNDALSKLAEPAKTAKKTAKTRKKKNLKKPDTEEPDRLLPPTATMTTTTTTTVVKSKIVMGTICKKPFVTESSEVVPVSSTAVKSVVATSATTVVKKQMSPQKYTAPVYESPAVVAPMKQISAPTEIEVTQSAPTKAPVDSTYIVSPEKAAVDTEKNEDTNKEVEEEVEEYVALPSPPKQPRRSSRANRSHRDSINENAPVPLAEPELQLEVTPEKASEAVQRKSKRSLTVDASKSTNPNEIVSPLARRSRLTETVEPLVVAPENTVSKKQSLRPSKSVTPTGAVNKEEPVVEPELLKPEIADSDEEDSTDEEFSDISDDDEETETEEETKVTPTQDKQLLKSGSKAATVIAPEKTAPVSTDSASSATDNQRPTRTRPVNKPTRTEAQTAGPEADQQTTTATSSEGPARTRVKNQANRPESRQAGPEAGPERKQESDLVIPSATALAEAEKAMKNYGKSGKATVSSDEKPQYDGATGMPKASFVKKVAAIGYGNAPPSAQKQPMRMGTPLKNTAAKKPLQPSTQYSTKTVDIGISNLPSGPATASTLKVLRVETPQQKNAMAAPVATGPVPVPFGSGGAPSKAKLAPSAVKNPSRPNSPIGGYNKVPIAMGLAGAVALGKIPAGMPVEEKVRADNTDAKPKYDNLVTNVMSFVPQSHGIQGATKHQGFTGITAQKLGSSSSTTALHKVGATTAMGMTSAKAKAEAKGLTSNTTSSTKLPTAKALGASGVSQSKLPVPVSGAAPPKPVPAAHIIVSQPNLPPPPPPPKQQQQPIAEENNPFNSTYTKGLDSTMAAFDITRFEDTYVDYPIDDVKPCGDDDDDEEEDTKPIPEWAKGNRLKERIAKQHDLDTRIRRRLEMDEDKVDTEGIEEALANPDRPARIRPRTSSQHWTTPPLLKAKGLKGKSPQH